MVNQLQSIYDSLRNLLTLLLFFVDMAVPNDIYIRCKLSVTREKNPDGDLNN